MTRTAGDILAEACIHVREIRHGNTVTLCPECSHTRRKKRELAELAERLLDAGGRKALAKREIL